MLRVGGIVLHRGVEPQPVALLAVVEGALERLRLAGAAPAAPSAAPAAAAARLVVAVPVLGVGGVLVAGVLLGLALGLQGLGHQRIVLGAQIRLVRLSAGRLPVGRVGRRELVLALE